MIKLTSDEIEKINVKVKTLRPNLLIKGLLYTQDMKEKINVFVVSYEFLKNIVEHVEEQDIKKKLVKYLSTFDKLYKQLFYYNQRMDSEIKFNKSLIMFKVNGIFSDNSSKILGLINFVDPLGKRILEFDPDEHAGSQEY